MCLIRQTRLAKHKNTILVRRTNQFISYLPRDRFREIHSPDFNCECLVQGDELERHFQIAVSWVFCGVLCAHRLWGKPSARDCVVAVGNINADRELIGSLGLKCRSTPGGLTPAHGKAATKEKTPEPTAE
jgi:hypothetical protein